MYGRNASLEDTNHFARLIIEGEQVAYFEPYLIKDCATNPQAANCKQIPVACFSWIGFVTDPKRVGPVFHSADFFGKAHFSISTLYRTLFGVFPSTTVKEAWIKKLKDGTSLSNIAKEMQAQLPLSAQGNWDAIDDVYRRILGRRADQGNCSFRDPVQPKKGTDCFWFWGIANGVLIAQDFIHSVRSMPEAISANQSQECIEKYPIQNDPHALGEYIRQVYRILLRRYPTVYEMRQALNGYEGGDTRERLSKLTNKILTSLEYQRFCPR